MRLTFDNWPREVAPNVFKVKSSTGPHAYEVTREGCNCLGFDRWGHCKHYDRVMFILSERYLDEKLCEAFQKRSEEMLRARQWVIQKSDWWPLEFGEYVRRIGGRYAAVEVGG